MSGAIPLLLLCAFMAGHGQLYFFTLIIIILELCILYLATQDLPFPGSKYICIRLVGFLGQGMRPSKSLQIGRAVEVETAFDVVRSHPLSSDQCLLIH